jgi:TatD DNase family protein
MLYDTHCHLNLEGYEEDLSQIIAGCDRDGIWLNNVGTTYASSVEAVRLAHTYGEMMFAVVGAHPENFLPHEGGYANSLDPDFNSEEFSSLAMDPKVVGIGECGLDYYRLPKGIDREKACALQSPAFVEQVRLAKELDKALVIHCRPSAGSHDAYEDCLQILAQEQPGRFEIHSFTGNWETCKLFLDLGAYVALNGIVTFDKSGTLSEVAQNIPADRLLLETDAPFLAPVPYRGKRNQPAYVAYTAEFVAKLRNAEPSELSELTFLNARSLFQV